MREHLTSLMKRLKDEQQRLLFAAAESTTLPSLSTIQRVADLELNIAAIENTLAELPVAWAGFEPATPSL
jgi:uncharacterized coiled-coil protein SlyX